MLSIRQLTRGRTTRSRAGLLKAASLNFSPNPWSRSISSKVTIPVNSKATDFSAVLLRDACSCPLCVHPSTRQRLFASADIPSDIKAKSVKGDADSGVQITWDQDTPGHPVDHTTELSSHVLQRLVSPSPANSHLDTQKMWCTEPLKLPDYHYDTYMNDDQALHQLLRQLRIDGLAFVTNIPRLEESLAKVATRIGPLKDTFYGRTWDVRTVPEAINAAYTSSDLGFHTDLLYFQQPPHVQFLHCMESASTGGASVFADGFKAAVDLFYADEEAFDVLATVPINYHYTHPDSNVYRTTKPVIDMHPLRIGEKMYTRVQDYLLDKHGPRWTTQMLVDCMDKINWGPPFQAPFSLHDHSTEFHRGLPALNEKVDAWHEAAQKFNKFLQRPEYLFERKMKPGECVLFDNTRTLHSRRAFDMADVGKPRWLRGTYVDRDPYLSKLRVLHNKFS